MRADGLELTIVGVGGSRRLRVAAASAREIGLFDGVAAETPDGVVLEGPLSAANAAAVRRSVPALRPRPAGLRRSAGTGDRLGLATTGHARAFQNHGSGLVPFFAQQSHREMYRLERDPQEVLDDATFGCVAAGWDGPVGADADHLKTAEEAERCLDAGFTTFTLDPGDFVNVVPSLNLRAALETLPWSQLEDNAASMERRYEGLEVDLGHSRLGVSGEELYTAAVKYGTAIAHVASMHRHLASRARQPIEFEVSVDETDEVTSLAEHVYLATELKRLEVSWVGFAPRYVGRFEKGVDYIGDRDALEHNLADHTRIAEQLGPYKISIHSGSDKFSIYPLVMRATNGRMHLKTSGTSYLVAIEIAALFHPDLFRAIYDASRQAYAQGRATYHVSAQLKRMPAVHSVPDEDLAELVHQFDCRQMLHVDYRAALMSEDKAGRRWMAEELKSLLGSRSEEFDSALENHLGMHLSPFSGAESHE